jgi:hypothetical protein
LAATAQHLDHRRCQQSTLALIEERRGQREEARQALFAELHSDSLHRAPNHRADPYASRWCIEVSIEDAKQLGGVGQARNRLQKAVERTVPFALVVNTLAICWYATAGHHPDDVQAARALAPWYRQKAQPSVLDMLAKLRRVIIAAQFRPADPVLLTPQEIGVIRLAWEDVAA